MNLREQAELDLGFILSDPDGMSWPITLTDPAGAETPLLGFSNDIMQSIDPQTGAVVTGNIASIALRMSEITGVPIGVSNTSSRPWVVEFSDIGGTQRKYRIVQSFPDRSLGLVTCILEVYV